MRWALAFLVAAGCASVGPQDRVVYHFSNRYEDLVEQLKARGVRFDVCEITLRNRKLSKEQFIADATYVPPGVAEVTRLQQREGYAYLKP